MSLPTHRKAGRSAVFDISRPDDGEDPKVKRGGLFGRLASAQPLLAAALVTLLLFGLYRQFSTPVVAAPHGHDRTVPAPSRYHPTALHRAAAVDAPGLARARRRAEPGRRRTDREPLRVHELYARPRQVFAGSGPADGVRQIVRIARRAAAAAVAPIDDARPGTRMPQRPRPTATAASASIRRSPGTCERARRLRLSARGDARTGTTSRGLGPRARAGNDGARAAAAAERPHALRVVRQPLDLERSWLRDSTRSRAMQRLKPDILSCRR